MGVTDQVGRRSFGAWSGVGAMSRLLLIVLQREVIEITEFEDGRLTRARTVPVPRGPVDPAALRLGIRPAALDEVDIAGLVSHARWSRRAHYSVRSVAAVTRECLPRTPVLLLGPRQRNETLAALTGRLERALGRLLADRPSLADAPVSSRQPVLSPPAPRDATPRVPPTPEPDSAGHSQPGSGPQRALPEIEQDGGSTAAGGDDRSR